MRIAFDTYVHEGPRPKYTLYHIWKCYTILKNEGPMGRRVLASRIKLGEGSVRSILDRMVKEGCVQFSKRGAVLTLKGCGKFNEVGVKSIDLQRMGLSTGINCAVLAKGTAEKIRTGIEERDIAVSAGAKSALVLVARNGRIVFPDDNRFPDQDAVEPLKTLFRVEDGDVMIIGSGSSPEEAEKGAVTAALELIEGPDYNRMTSRRLFSDEYEEGDIKCIALTIHELVGRLPVTMRTKNHYGVRCEDGRIIETSFTGPVLEETLRKGKVIRRMSKAGKYRGCPVLAVPFIRNNETIAVVGVFDTTCGSYYEWMGKVRK
jgi:hypothetical protein